AGGGRYVSRDSRAGNVRGSGAGGDGVSALSECYRRVMDVETLISVDEYLNSSYDPDVEYVDGVLVERNVGDLLHSLTQRNIVVALTVRYPQIYAVPE